MTHWCVNWDMGPGKQVPAARVGTLIFTCIAQVLEGTVLEQDRYRVDGRKYELYVMRRVNLPAEAPRLIVVSYQPNRLASAVVRTCIQAIQQLTPEPHELWVVDNNSPRRNCEWLLRWPNLNVALNRTEPVVHEKRGLMKMIKHGEKQWRWGSYANAVGLELGIRCISRNTHHIMTLHMDTMPCREGWLSFLRSRLTDRVVAAGVRMDRTRNPEGILHVLGCLVDFQLFRKLGLNFFPKLPEYDVGDLITVQLRRFGYRVFACSNSLWEPHLVEEKLKGSFLEHLTVDRSFDHEGNVIFLHLGRSIRKSQGMGEGCAGAKEWIAFAQKHVLL